MTPRAKQCVLDEGVSRFCILAQAFMRDRFGTLLSERTDAELTERGQLVARPNLTVLLAAVDAFLDAVAPDDADLSGRIDGFAGLYQTRGLRADEDTAAWWLHRLWRARARRIDDRAVRHTAAAHLRALAPLQLLPADALAVSGLQFRLGAHCLGDPQHGWLRAVMEDPAPDDDARGQKLGQAVITEIRARQGEA